MPGLPHESTAWTFFLSVAIKIYALPGHTPSSIVPTGAARFGAPGKGSKEADARIRPATRGKDEWPSFVFELGYSESLPALHIDSQWWLINSSGQTKWVMIIRTTENLFSLHLELWTMVPNPNVVRPTRYNPLQSRVPP